MEAATAERPASAAGENDLEPEDDGLGDDGSGVPGGVQPGDEGYEPPGGQEPPTPPAALPDDGEEDEPGSDQLLLMADRELGLKVGGRKPDSSVLKLKGGKIDLQGQFNRGDRFLAVATLQVTGDNDQDTIDKLSGDVKSTSKAQGATLCGITRLGEYLDERISDTELLNAVLAALEDDGK